MWWCHQGLPIMVFSTDEASNKAVIYAGVPADAPNGFKVLDWLTPSIAPLKGKGGSGKNGLAQGQVRHRSLFRHLNFGEILVLVVIMVTS